jgi:23S rRNA pseudouridine2605 synthase
LTNFSPAADAAATLVHHPILQLLAVLGGSRSKGELLRVAQMLRLSNAPGRSFLAKDVNGVLSRALQDQLVEQVGGSFSCAPLHALAPFKLALNKPAGYVSTAKDPQGRPTVVSLVPSRERLYPVGRLDADTTGLLLLTNDGELAHRLTHPSFEVPRVYRAQVRSPPVREPALRKLRDGVQLEDGRTAPARVRRLAPDKLEIVLHEGRKRQVRRMCDAVGHQVVRLERVAFGPLRLGDLPLGGHRRLTAAEVERLRRITRR